ncbi:MAG: hypothetical protein ACI31E_03305 [Muribaculaceae bacterium]
MTDDNEILLNKSHIPNNPLRVDIVDAVNDYIGYAYADDVHLDDYLTIDKKTLAVSRTRRRLGEPREDNLAYYEMSTLLAPGDSPFTYVPDELDIDAIVLEYFPIEALNNFPDLVEAAVQEFLRTHDVSDESTIGFPIDTFKPEVYNLSEIETQEATEEDYLDEEFLMAAEYIEVPLKKYIRYINGKLTVYKHKLLVLALNNYYD